MSARAISPETAPSPGTGTTVLGDLAEHAPRLRALRDLTRRVAIIDPLANDSDADALGRVATELRGLLERVIGLLGEVLATEDDEPVSCTLEDADDSFVRRAPPPTAETTAPHPRIGDLCFAGQLELQRALRELAAARTFDDQLTACETAHRKLLRAAGAVLDTARIAGYHDALDAEDHVRSEALDCGPALAVRRAYAAFRKGLRRPEDNSPEAVMAAVRYAATALATLVSTPAYSDVRASDRIALRGLRRRALAWARDDRSPREGLRLLQDVWTCADLLREINQRQELRAHDAALIRSLLDGPNGEPGEWMTRLERLTGLDDELDELIEHGKGTTGNASLFAVVGARLGQLR